MLNIVRYRFLRHPLVTGCHASYSSGTHYDLSKILIANRGEIACRIIRTARKMGVKSVAVFSTPDQNSLHVSMADEAYHIGAAASSQSYLNKQKIIDVAKASGAQAIHPGYGFLSENTEFAELCEREGVVFIGPPASAIRDMGIKSTSKSIMSAAGVPIIQGYHGDDQSLSRLKNEAEKIGYPIMIKAVRGGGGKGMRIAMTANQFEEQLDSAKREAQKAVGDDVMLLEKFVETPRHVEVQVFGDHHGNYVYLFERDCSVQRRHQKIIEEAPAPGISEATRRAIGEAAVKAAKAVNYVGAGTVEFIMDKNEKFYFMEMNTRLQVEHPITEMITGVDLVEWQIKVAGGRPLPQRQEELKLRGHAFEARVYAEDPKNNFMPGAGMLQYLATPEPRTDLRIETGVRQGDEVSVHYDPMIAKVVVWAEDRNAALLKIQAALLQYHVAGLSTNVPFLLSLASHAHFAAGEVHTGFIGQHHGSLFPVSSLPVRIVCQAALAVSLLQQQVAQRETASSRDVSGPFMSSLGRRINHVSRTKITLADGDKSHDVWVSQQGPEAFEVACNGVSHVAAGHLTTTDNGRSVLISTIDGVTNSTSVHICANTVHIFTTEGSYELSLPEANFLKAKDKSAGSAGGAVAPMPGVIEKVNVKIGDSVKEGDALVSMIAMKMEYILRASQSGVVESISCKPGDTVGKGVELVRVKNS